MRHSDADIKKTPPLNVFIIPQPHVSYNSNQHLYFSGGASSYIKFLQNECKFFKVIYYS